MKTELMQYAEAFEAEILGLRELSNHDFIKQFIDDSFHGNIDDEYTLIDEYFCCLEMKHYFNEDYSYYEICLGCGGPNIYLNVNTRWESVEYVISWGGESYSKELNYLYDEIVGTYLLDGY